MRTDLSLLVDPYEWFDEVAAGDAIRLNSNLRHVVEVSRDAYDRVRAVVLWKISRNGPFPNNPKTTYNRSDLRRMRGMSDTKGET